MIIIPCFKRVYLDVEFKAFFMKTYSVLICLSANGNILFGQNWEKKYDRVGAFSSGLAVVKKAGKFGYVNEYGKAIVLAIYDEAVICSEHKAAVRIWAQMGICRQYRKRDRKTTVHRSVLLS